LEHSLRCAIVLPFLNEKDLLLSTCASLGFDGRQHPTSAVLFLVDNGSDDGSEVAAAELQRQSALGAVHYVRAQERGHAPARAEGNVAVLSWAKRQGLAFRDVLVLQADADTIYSPGYVDTMRAAAVEAPPDALIESIVGYPNAFVCEHSSYFDAVAANDTALQTLYASDAHDCLVDDKAVGYRLDSYLSWSGHRREYQSNEEILAETTRLFIAARIAGSVRVRVDGAQVAHSPRRLLAEPSLHTACGGFPRGDSWRKRWLKEQVAEAHLDRLGDDGAREWSRAWNERRKHLIALLGVLPEQIRRATADVEPRTRLERFVAKSLPQRTRSQIFAAPGLVVADALTCVDDFGEELLAMID
jgi:glycosyltransferase involved in cell wall biosynthesis